MKYKKIISFGLMVSLLVAALTGCGGNVVKSGGEDGIDNQAESGRKETAAMGRYVEESMELPKFAELERVLDLVQGETETFLYTFEEKAENTGSYYRYCRQEDGEWEKEDSVWLNAVSRGEKLDIRDIRTDEEAVYAWYFDQEYLSHIIKTTDEKEAEEIKIDDLAQKENVLSGFVVTGKGEVALSYLGGSMSGGMVLYSAEDGRELRRFKCGTLDMDNVSLYIDASGNKLAVLNEDRKGFTIYDTDTGDILDEFESIRGDRQSMDGMIKIGQEDDYYYMSEVGLSHFQSGGSIMETLIDGSLNTMGVEGISRITLLIGEAQDYTVLFADGSDYGLAHYTYDSNIPTVPEYQLTMYGLQENKSVSRAIGTYQKENPDVQILYYTAQSEEGVLTDADSIRALNTELLAEKGADILLPSVTGVLVFVLLLFLDVVRRSFYEAMGSSFTGSANYRLVLQNEAFKLAVHNTVRFLAVCIPLLLLVSLVIALLIQGSHQHSDKFKTIFLVPMAVPIASVVLLWKLVFDNAGYLNRIMELCHLESVDWMNGASAFYVLVFSYLWKNTGYDMVLWLAGLNGISLSLYEAAKVDGAGTWKCFRYITLPNLKSTVFMITVLSFVNSFKVFREAYLVAGDYPNESIYMLQHLFNNWFVNLDIHKMSAAAVMTSAVIIGMLILVQWLNGRAGGLS